MGLRDMAVIKQLPDVIAADPFSRTPGAFSSEVDTGSRRENATKQKIRAPFRFNRNGKGSIS
jgi:hypothetical protein